MSPDLPGTRGHRQQRGGCLRGLGLQRGEGPSPRGPGAVAENVGKTWGKRGENRKTRGKPTENPWKTHGKPMENPYRSGKTHGKNPSKKIEHEIMRDLMVVFFVNLGMKVRIRVMRGSPAVYFWKIIELTLSVGWNCT